MITETIREYVRSECNGSGNAFGAAFFVEHLAVVDKYGQMLAKVLSADVEIVELAAYLHDIAAIRDITTVPQHAVLGAQAAREILARHSYPSERVERVARCALSHSAPVQMGGGPLEEVCLSNADAMAQIARPVYWFYYLFGVRRFDLEKGRDWWRQRVQTNWELLVPPARRIIETEYNRARDLLMS